MTSQNRDIAPNYFPRSWAKPIHASTAKRKVLWVHRRGGKGWFSHHEGLKAFVQRINDPVPYMKTPKFHAWSVAPSFPQARQTENELESYIPDFIRPKATSWDGSKGHSRADHTFTLLTSEGSGLWEIKSAHEPEALQTVGLDFLHVQECQDISEAAFNKLLPVLRDPDRLGLSIWEGIPPEDPGHWFARLIAEAEEDTTGHSIGIKVPYTDNPDLIKSVRQEILADAEIMTEREWRRMYMVELPMGSGSFLGDVDGCITAEPFLTEPEPEHRYVMGIDLAKKVDFTVIIIMDACHNRMVYQRRIGQLDWPVQEEAIKYAWKQFHVSRIRLDSTGLGDPVFDRLRYDGLPVEAFTFTNETKYRILTDLAIGIEKHRIAYPSVPVMLRELKSLRAVRLPSGRSRVAAPGSQHDDYPMALAMAYSLCDIGAIDMAKWNEVKPSRYAPAIDTMKPGGLAYPVKKSDWRAERNAARAAARIIELEAQGIDV